MLAIFSILVIIRMCYEEWRARKNLKSEEYEEHWFD